MHRLALALGRTIEELGASMSSRELSRWQAYDRISPIGEIQADARHGVLCTLVARVAGNKTARPLDFIPFREPEEKKDQSRKSMLTALWEWTKAVGAQVKRG